VAGRIEAIPGPYRFGPVDEKGDPAITPDRPNPTMKKRAGRHLFVEAPPHSGDVGKEPTTFLVASSVPRRTEKS
jgi:hypothetical protein